MSAPYLGGIMGVLWRRPGRGQESACPRFDVHHMTTRTERTRSCDSVSLQAECGLSSSVDPGTGPHRVTAGVLTEIFDFCVRL